MLYNYYIKRDLPVSLGHMRSRGIPNLQSLTVTQTLNTSWVGLTEVNP